MVFQVKICGVRSVADVEAVASSARAIDAAIGLNFYPPSTRYLDPTSEDARSLATTASQHGLKTVGVFVNESTSKVCEIADQLMLDAVQFHGDETANEVANAKEQLGNTLLIRAVKLPTNDLTAQMISERCALWKELSCHLLLDADAGAAHGGSGHTLNWAAVSQWAQTSTEITWTLAGGLTPQNVGNAIKTSGTQSVDTASGVEQPRGTKSADLIEQFFTSTQWA